MKNIVVLGAGQSTPALIQYLLDQAIKHDWQITVADRDAKQAAERINDHPRGRAIPLDVTDPAARLEVITQADLVANLLPPPYQPAVAKDCVRGHAHMVSASYCDRTVASLGADAEAAGVLLLTECGLDPGIDLMSAAEIIQRIADAGGYVERFLSYGSGVPAPDVPANPLRYCITWNPRNVVLAGASGAQYLVDGQIKIVPWRQVFERIWPVEVDGVGAMEAYANRDSLAYQSVFPLDHCHTLIRGTLRYPGFCETWRQVVRLGLPNEQIAIPDLGQRSFAELVEMFLPPARSGAPLLARVADALGIVAEDPALSRLRDLGLFDTQPAGVPGRTAADALVFLLCRELVLPETARDLVIILHELDVCYPRENHRRERITTTFRHYGTPGGVTAMAQTVGLPAALAAELILTDAISLTGCHIPTHPQIYTPILAALRKLAMVFDERTVPIED